MRAHGVHLDALRVINSSARCALRTGNPREHDARDVDHSVHCKDLVSPARIGSFVSLALFASAFVVLVAPAGGTDALADRAHGTITIAGQERLIVRDEPVAADVQGACPANTVEVEGDYCPQLEQKCLKY